MSENNFPSEERRLRNKMAQTRHREKRKIAERENSELRQRIRELERELARVKKGQIAVGNADNLTQEIHNEHLTLKETDQDPAGFSQSHRPYSNYNPNFMFPQLRMGMGSRSLSVSSIASTNTTCSSVYSNIEGFYYQEQLQNDDDQQQYMPNCHQLMPLNSGCHAAGSIPEDLSDLSLLNDYSDFGMDSHDFANAFVPSTTSDSGFACDGTSTSLQNFDAIQSAFDSSHVMIPMSSSESNGFSASADNATDGYILEDLDLITPRPRAVTD